MCIKINVKMKIQKYVYEKKEIISICLAEKFFYVYVPT